MGTTAVRAELDALEGWLVPYELALVRRRGYGVAIEGLEFQKRLALEAALHQRFPEGDLLALFRGAGQSAVSPACEAFLLERFPRSLVTQIDGLFDQVSREESWEWAPSAGLAMSLRLVTALQRVQAGFVLEKSPTPEGDLGPTRRLLERLTQTFGIRFSEREVEWAFFHLEASKPNRSFSIRPVAPDLARGVEQLVGACGRLTGFPFAGDATLVEGLTAHWGPALARMSHRLPVENALLPEIRQRFPELMAAVTQSLAEAYPQLLVPTEEVGYLVLHFAASVERHHGEGAPFRALIVCSSGIGTSHMLASRLRAEVPEIEVVANLSWFDVKDFSRDEYDLLISTVQLPLPEADYVVVSPLLDDQGLRTLKDHLRRRRLGLTGQAGFKENPRRTPEPVWGEAALSVLMDGLTTPEAKAALAAGNPTELRAVLARILGHPRPRTPQGE